MGKLGDFFSMTRHERVGTITVMALLGVAIVAAVAVRSCNGGNSCPPQAVEAAARFAAEADTATAAITASKHHGKHRKPRRLKKAESHKPKSAPDRPLTPVPSF